VRTLGGDPETESSLTGYLHRGWINLKSLLTGKDDQSVLSEVERGEEFALKAYNDACEKLVKLGRSGDHVYTLIHTQQQGVQRTYDQVKALQNKNNS